MRVKRYIKNALKPFAVLPFNHSKTLIRLALMRLGGMFLQSE